MRDSAVLPLKDFSSINSFIDSIKGKLFSLERSLIFFTEVSPIPLLGVLIILSKAKLSKHKLTIETYNKLHDNVFKVTEEN